jgi:hypothetical protein
LYTWRFIAFYSTGSLSPQSFIYRSFFITPISSAMSGSGSSAAASAASNRTVKEVYSCSACHVSFTDRQTQRAHMKDDWQ